MASSQWFKDKVLNASAKDFEELALAAFAWQYRHNPLYRQWVDLRKVRPSEVSSPERIPFLPVRFFKEHRVISQGLSAQVVFESSGTTGQMPSRHWVADPRFYEAVSVRIFEEQYGPLSQFVILALLPSYLERGASSLVYMVNHFHQFSQQGSGFYLHNTKELLDQARRALEAGKQLLLMGVTYALLDLAEAGKQPLTGAIVMETGGMKGRRREMIREEVHQILREGLGVAHIHSEYGMTELLSQAYAKQEGVFELPNWARILIRDLYDPFSYTTQRNSGGVNMIDLANIDSCCFLEIEDIAQWVDPGKSFKILGRASYSELRGCNLMIDGS